MTDPDRGQCEPAIAGGGPLIDPTCGRLKSALEEAFRRASEDEATLILAFIGHGQYVGNDFYFLTCDAPERPNSERAVDIIRQIDNWFGEYPRVDGLILLVDTCFSGSVVRSGACDLVGEYRREEVRSLRFEILTASAPDREARGGCFIRTLTRCIREGLGTVAVGELRCRDIEKVVREQCTTQQPESLAFNPSVPIRRDVDLWIAANVAHSQHAWAGTRDAVQITRLTADFQPTPILDRIVAASREHRNVAVVGEAGAGKSALAAALMRPEITDGAVPEGFAHAVAFLGGQLSGDLARSLADQLDRTLPGFKTERERLNRSLSPEARGKLDSLLREVVYPLRSVHPPDGTALRIVVDALDQIPTADESTIRSALAELTNDPALGHVHLIATARRDTDLIGLPEAVAADRVDDEIIATYLARRAAPTALHGVILRRAAGNWLVARLLADLALADPKLGPDAFPADLRAIYAENFRRAGAASSDRWRRELRPILGVLAAAGVGPILPFELLRAASTRLGGPDRPFQVRDVLVDLRGLVVRSSPGTDDEHVGLFHPTLAEYLLDPTAGPFGLDPVEPHRALAECLAQLDPIEAVDEPTPDGLHPLRDAIGHYAALREPEHLWAIGERQGLLDSLEYRPSAVPAENLERWQNWSERLRHAMGQGEPDALRIHQNIAHWTGKSGDAREAARLYEELLPELVQAFGPTDPKILSTLNKMAGWTGETGNAQGALALYQRILLISEQILEADHPDRLRTRGELAEWTGRAGRAGEAVRLYGELLRNMEQMRGPGHRETLAARGSLAGWVGEAGRPSEAVKWFIDLLRDRERVLGPTHRDTLRTREDVAYWTGRSGRPPEAAQLFRKLLDERVRVLGPNDRDTLRTRCRIIYWNGPDDGELAQAKRYAQVLRDQERALGRYDRDTLRTREDVAHWTVRAGHMHEAARIYREMLVDREQSLGPSHRDTLRTRALIARFTGQSGSKEEAVQLYRELLRDQSRFLGPHHPDTLRTRGDIAEWTGWCGQSDEAARLYLELIRDCDRTIGPDHPFTFDTRRHLAISLFKAGRSREIIRLLRELIADLGQVLGNDHPTTMNFRELLARYKKGRRDRIR
jgi:tetratricopeptide (TPR) repeat protein